MSAPSHAVTPPHRRPRLRGRAAVMRSIAVLVAIGIVWRCLRYALAFPIWGDEAFVAINFLHRDFAGMLKPLEYGQIVPVALMWAELAVTRWLGMSEYALRLLPFLAGVASVLLFRRFATTVLDPRSALMAVGIFAASYYPVRHGTEIKPYAFDLLVSLVLTAMAWGVYQQPRATGRWIALTMTAALGLWLSYPAAFVAAGIGLLLTCIIIRERSRSAVILWLAYGLCLSASFLGVFLISAGPHAETTWAPGSPDTLKYFGPGFPPITQPLRLPLWLIENHTGNMMAYPFGGKNGGSTLTFLLVLIGVVVLWRRQRALLLLLLAPLLFTFVAAAMQRYPYGYSARLAQHVAPAFCLLAGLGLATAIKASLQPRRVPQGIRIATLVLIGIAFVGIARDVAKPYKTISDRENRRVLRWLAENTGPRDQWISFNVPTAGVQHADDIYLRGGGAARYRLYLHRLAPVPLLWAPPPLEVRHPAGGRTWLINFRDARHTEGSPFPEKALADYVEILARTSGPPRHQVFALDKDQSIEFYQFPAVQDAELQAPAE